jgi:hypothetical protein
MEDLLARARRELIADGWTDLQVEAAIRYALRWARGNASVGSNGDPAFYQRLVQNYLPRGLEQAREWLQKSRSRWTSDL